MDHRVLSFLFCFCKIIVSKANNKNVKTVKKCNKYSGNLNIVGFCGPDGGDSS